MQHALCPLVTTWHNLNASHPCLCLQLICQPSPNLANSTDARTKFANLTRTASLGGQNISGIFASDLTLAQVKTLTVNQTTGTGRDQSYNGQLQVNASTTTC